MKKILLLLMALVVSATAAMADSYTIKREKLPEAAQQFLTEHFPKAKVAMIKVDRHLLKKTDYDVKLVDGTKIEFSNAGKWTSVSRKQGKAVPDGIVPKAIRRYVTKNYPGETITEIEKKSSHYEVELSAGVELRFSLLGSFQRVVGIDD